jgi:hypothetical protein
MRGLANYKQATGFRFLSAAFHGCSRPDGADPDAEELGVYAAVRLAEVNATGSEMGQGL